MKTYRVPAAAGVLLLVASSAHAMTVSGLNPDSSSFVVTAGPFSGDYNGVAELTIVRSDLNPGAVEGCSGALLSDGISILTAADCIAGSNGALEATSAYVTFSLPDGSYSTTVAKFQVNPLYNGSAQSPYNVAVLTLAAPAPAAVTRYDLYDGDSLDETITPAEYQLGGIRKDDGDSYPASSETPAATLLGYIESFFSPGDNGAPSFIDGRVAGVHAFLSGYRGDVSVTDNLTFIDSMMDGVPEPKTMFLVGSSLIAFSLMGSKRRLH